ncbi:MAG TPA: chromosomal replication initiator protein DnaA [Spirochaetota bacterium]|jgi:chromosomal replication initiator protein|nr:MAG: Chromosomal replication initiator protein DnaA [Spirochaetes bacterium ADurb.Bin133]HNZ25610.1 chromosomal replication initiator protein DnaA [Spirochaetota bacterium]HPY88003.1 chromosomal replication initiator protein DnaA [Spirochaetota bacterium]
MKNTDYKIYWDEIKKELELVIRKSDYKLWISRIEYYDFKIKDKVMYLSVPSNFIKDNALRFKEDIESILTRIFGQTAYIEFVIFIPNDEAVEEIRESALPKKEKIELKKQNGAQNDKNIDNIENFSFDSFIVGASNEFAAETAKIVAQNPGIKYNPYFIWGDSGLGKTHLLRSIEKYIKEYFPSKKVLYLTSEDFLNDFVHSFLNNTQQQFRIKYRQLDVLLIDDVQFFSSKEAIQAELFHTFNKLSNSNKQMVFSCDQPINKVKKIENRLRSRFSMGLTVDLRPPDFELRIAILKRLSSAYSLNFTSEAMEYICSNSSGSVRDLKGSFKDLLAYSSIMKIETITKDVAIERLKDKITTNLYSSPISVDKIILSVSQYFNIKSHDITGIKRTKSIVLARQISMYLSRKLTRLSTTQIGAFFGDKEHGTVMHATKKIDDLIIKDSKIKNDIDFLINSIRD